VGGLALGAWIGAEMTTTNREVVLAEPQAIATPAVEEPARPAKRAKPTRLARAPRAASNAAVVESRAARSEPKLVMTIPVSAPELHRVMKPVLARGTKLPLAVEGFSSAEQFATIAHAARNTQVPFILLKHRVLTEGQSLEAAIRASKPDLDARMEVRRARDAARSDLAAIAPPTLATNN
jgi:hypothetical protein